MYVHNKKNFLKKLVVISDFFECTPCEVDSVHYSGKEVLNIIRQELKSIPEDTAVESYVKSYAFRSYFDEYGDYRFKDLLPVRPDFPGEVVTFARVNSTQRSDPSSEVFIHPSEIKDILQWTSEHNITWLLIRLLDGQWLLYVDSHTSLHQFPSAFIRKVHTRNELFPPWN